MYDYEHVINFCIIIIIIIISIIIVVISSVLVLADLQLVELNFSRS